MLVVSYDFLQTSSSPSLHDINGHLRKSLFSGERRGLKYVREVFGVIPAVERVSARSPAGSIEEWTHNLPAEFFEFPSHCPSDQFHVAQNGLKPMCVNLSASSRRSGPRSQAPAWERTCLGSSCFPSETGGGSLGCTCVPKPELGNEVLESLKTKSRTK